MHVVKKQFMYVSKPFGRGGGGARVCNVCNTFFKNIAICINGSFKSGRGTKSYWLPNPCLLGGPKVGGNATSSLHSPGSRNKGGQNQNWRGLKVGENAMSPLHSRGSPTKGTNSKHKKDKKHTKKFPIVSLILPRVLHIAAAGV